MKLRTNEDAHNSAAFWYPLIASAQLPVPETKIIHYPYGYHELMNVLDGAPTKGFNNLITDIDHAIIQIGGYPAFLRTEMSSDKHDWKNTCYVESRQKLNKSIGLLIEHSAMHDLECSFWLVRKLIPTTPIATAFYGDMPIAKERRAFAENGKLICEHPYWPKEAFENHPIDEEKFNELQQIEEKDLDSIKQMAVYVTKRIPGAWSIDFLQDSQGKWWLIDMALAKTSYHWPTCPNKDIQERIDLITGERITD